MASTSPRGAAGLHGDRLARHFGITATSALSVSRSGLPAVAITRLRGAVTPDQRTRSLRAEPAYSIVVQLRDLGHHELILANRLVHTGPVPAGAVSAISLEDLPRSSMSGEFDAVQLYVPHLALREFTQAHDLGRVEGLRWPRAQPDPTALALTEMLLPAIAQPDRSLSLFVEHVTLAFLAHAVQHYGGAPAGGRSLHGRLAPWQERRAKEMMRARLATSLSIAEVSAECRLSPSHFAAAFRRSTGRSPHRFLSEQRIEEAKNLLLTTALPLADISLLCGFGDQSHFTRVFTQLVGGSPGRWRRLHRTPPADLVDDHY